MEREEGEGRTRITWFMVARVGDVVVNERVTGRGVCLGRENDGLIEGMRKRRRTETAILGGAAIDDIAMATMRLKFWMEMVTC